MTYSLNNRLVLELYNKEALKPRMQGGIATPGQRDGLKGLKVLMDARLPEPYGRVPAGSVAYIREEILHTHDWASKPMTCDFLSSKFLVVDIAYVEFIDTPNYGDSA